MPLSRRAFLKLGSATLSSALTPRPRRSPLAGDPSEWLPGVPLGRVTESRIRLYSRPNPEGKDIGFKYRDDVVIVVREVVGKGFYPHNHVWFETPEGYAYSSWVQPVRYAPNEPLPAVPPEGMYVEVSVPFTDAHAQPDPQSPILYRLYYGTTYQVSRREVAADGSVWYRLNDENVVKTAERGQAEHFRPIAPEEFALLSPGVSDKLIVVTLSEQSLSAYEDKAEVFRARISSGRNYFGPDATTLGSLTPAGEHPLWQKRASRHTLAPALQVQVCPEAHGKTGMTCRACRGYRISLAMARPCTGRRRWHNDYGTPKSAGCINLRPQDAKWLFRWTLPEVPYVPGYITVEWPGGAKVIIQD